MKIEMINERYVVGVGFKNVGDIIDCDNDMALNLISQGLAKEKKKEKSVKHTEGVKEE